MLRMDNFDRSLKLTKISLLLSGIKIHRTKWNEPVEFFVDTCLFYLNFLWLYTDVIAEFSWLIEGVSMSKSIIELSLIAPCTTICLLATAKSTPLYYNRTNLLNTVNELRDMFPDTDGNAENKDNTNRNTKDKLDFVEQDKLDDTERNIVKESLEILKRVVLLLFGSSLVVFFLFCFTPLVVMGYNYYIHSEVELALPFLVKYFFDPFTKTRWPFVYFHQIWSTVITVVNVFGPDTLLYAFCVHTQMHFHILCHRFENLFSRTSETSDERRRRQLCLLKTHQNLIRLVDDINNMYSSSSLFNIIISSLLICLSGFNVTTNSDATAVIAFTMFLIMSISQIAILCYFGDMLISSSTQVTHAVYNCQWYNANERDKKTLLIVLRRAQSPCRLTAGSFAVLDLSAFSKILSRSWSYFALLKTVYN